jgi:uncharacterized membrane protein YhaH (DUF805 family)
MDIQTAVSTCFSKYATFSGRARRAEYWWFTLFLFIANAILGLLDGMSFGWGHGMGQPLSALFSLATFLPSLAVSVRRLHDTGRSGWWLLLVLIPLIGWLVLLWWFVTEGDAGANAYGPDPLRDDDAGPSSVPPVPRT